MPLPKDRTRKKNRQRKDGSWNLSLPYLQHLNEGGSLTPEAWNTQLQRQRQDRANQWLVNWRRAHPEKCKEYSDKANEKVNPEYHKEAMRKYRERHPTINQSHNFARRLGNGLICIECGSVELVEKHHPDYNKPYEVVYLCRTCHMKLHQIPDESIQKKQLARLVELNASCAVILEKLVRQTKEVHPEWNYEKLSLFFSQVVGNALVASDSRINLISKQEGEK
jgi:hypothetical protein